MRPRRLEFALFGCGPAIFTLVAFVGFWSVISVAGDFHKEFWPAGLRVLHGHSPYLPDAAHVDDGTAFPYPAPAALLFAVLALVPRHISEVIFAVACIGAVLGTLRVLEVRDWRLYGVVLVWAPVVNGWQSGNVSLLLALGIALVWRFRDRPVLAGCVAAAIVSLKPWVWPVFVWLLATRRFRGAAYGVIAGAALNVVAFGVLGFDEIGRYLGAAGHASSVFVHGAYTPMSLALRLGAGNTVADAVGVACAVAAGAACVYLGRRRDEVGALALAIALALLATPVLWMHYFALIIVPLALARPRLELLWLLPIAMLDFTSRSTAVGETVIVLGVMGLLLAGAARARPAGAGRHLVPASR
jgi:hypothetical protein